MPAETAIAASTPIPVMDTRLTSWPTVHSVLICIYCLCYGAIITTGDPHPLADDGEDDDLFEDRFSIAYNLDREFGPRLKEHVQYCMTHPEERSKLSKLKAQITEAKGIMMDNVEKVLDRGERIELLVDKTDNLQFQVNKAPHFRVLFHKFLHIHDGLRIFFQADIFQRQGRQLRRKMWFQNIQMKLMIGGAVAVIILLFWLISRADGK